MNKHIKLSLILLVSANVFAADDSQVVASAVEAAVVAEVAPVVTEIAAVEAAVVAEVAPVVTEVTSKPFYTRAWESTKNATKSAKDGVVKGFNTATSKATYVNADGTYNKKNIAIATTAVVVTTAVAYYAYKAYKNKKAQDDEDDQE